MDSAKYLKQKYIVADKNTNFDMLNKETRQFYTHYSIKSKWQWEK